MEVKFMDIFKMQCIAYIWFLIMTANQYINCTQKTLQCWQCVSLKDAPRRCPEEAVLYELTDWDACTLWFLRNGTIVLQNFVNATEDCTKSKIKHWRNYMSNVWNEVGSVICCNKNGCNRKIPTTDSTSLLVDSNNGVVSNESFFSTIDDCQKSFEINNEDTVGEQWIPKTVLPIKLDQIKPKVIYVGKEDIHRTKLKKLGLFIIRLFDANLSAKKFYSIKIFNDMQRISIYENYFRIKDGYTENLVSNNFHKAVKYKVVSESFIGFWIELNRVGSIKVGRTSNPSQTMVQWTDQSVDAFIPQYFGFTSTFGTKFVVKTNCLSTKSSSILLTHALSLGATCKKCDKVPHSICYSTKTNKALHLKKHVYTRTVKQFTNKTVLEPICKCMAGFIAIRNSSSGELTKCYDPIIKTDVIGGQCLINHHCHHLNNTICQEDVSLKRASGLTSFKTCQCVNSLSCEQVMPCVKDEDCKEKNSICDTLTAKCTRCRFILNGSQGRKQAVASYVRCNRSNSTTLKIDCYHDVWRKRRDHRLICRCKNGGEIEAVYDRPKNCVYYPMDKMMAFKSKSSTKDELKLGPSNCANKAIVLEDSSWIPETQHKFNKDEISGAMVAIIYTKLTRSANANDGIKLRLLRSNPNKQIQKRKLYTIILKKKGEVSIWTSFIEFSGQEKEVQNVQHTIRENQKWIQSQNYTGFWIAFKRGVILLGVMGNQRLDKPLISWKDTSVIHDPIDVSILGISAIGRAALVKIECGSWLIESLLPPWTCSNDTDCNSVAPNTECVAEANVSTLLSFKTCKCFQGFEPIPEPLRSNDLRGCFDPIRNTQTVNAPCRNQKHCFNLPGTLCVSKNGLFLPNSRFENTCRCRLNYVPMTPNRTNGLIMGCTLLKEEELLTFKSCQRKIMATRENSWIPSQLLSINFDPSKGHFLVSFYIKFGFNKSRIVGLTLLDGEKSSARVFRLIWDMNTQRLSLFEGIRVQHFIIGRDNMENLKESTPINFYPNKYQGFWVSLDPERPKGDAGVKISIGRISERPLFTWTNKDFTIKAETKSIYGGFSTLEGATNTEIKIYCYHNIPNT